MKKYIIVFILFLFLFIPNVNALNGICMIDSSSSDVKQNDEIIINFYIHDINDLGIKDGYLELKYDSSVFSFVKVVSTYEGIESSVVNENGIVKITLTNDDYISDINKNTVLASIKFKVKDSALNGISTITMMGEDVSYVTDINGNNNSCLSVGNKNLYFNVYNSNSEALLSNLIINKGNLNPKFDKNITNYNVTVSNNIDSIIISSNCTVDGCNISGNGNKRLEVGKNVVRINVTSPNNKVTKTYTLIVTREAQKNEEEKKEEIVKDNNALLRTLSVSDGSLDPTFDPEVTEYKVEVDSNVSKIRINAVCAGIECTVKGTGNKYLKYGENSYEIEVVAEDGTNKIYAINVIRKYDLKLTSLIIETYKLSPKFDEEIYTYRVTVKPDVDKLNITAQATDPSVRVRILGNSNFVEGENVIKIEVSHDDGDKKVYTILVDKTEKDNNISDTKSIWDNTYVIIGGIIAGVLLFCIIVGVIWFLLKKKNENN